MFCISPSLHHGESRKSHILFGSVYAINRSGRGEGVGGAEDRSSYRAADKSLARPERKKATATEFNIHISYL